MRRRRPIRVLLGLVVLLVAAKVTISCGPWSRYRTDAAWRRDVARATQALPASPAGAVARDAYEWVRRAIVPAPYREACDLASTPSGLVVAASIDALGVDGAALYRIGRDGRLANVLTWNGQGFLRVHAFGDRLVVPDADAPFNAMFFAFDLDVDGYVFVSDSRGSLEPSMREVVPRVYHVFDTARLRDGTLVASTGAYPPSDVPYLSRHAPAALFVDDGPNRPWRRVLEYPSRDVRAVVRFTYLEALDDGALLAAIQSSDETHPAAVRIEGLPNAPRLIPITGLAGTTLRWASFRGAIYRIAGAGSDARASRSTDGGRSFEPLDVTSPESFAPTDATLFLLDGGALYASGDGIHFERVAASHPSLVSPPSTLISSPLVVHAGSLWSASVRTGEVFEAVARYPR